MRKILFTTIGALLFTAAPTISKAQIDSRWKIHDPDRPLPPLVDPGTPSTQDSPGRPPSDAVVLFDGKDLSHWSHKDVFPSHYHLVGESEAPESLRSFVRHLHTVTASEANKWDAAPGRRVWFEYWETRITFPRSCFARLNYVHQNAVRHGLVRLGSQYPWCSAGWFEREATRSFFQTVSGFRTDKLNVPDDFEMACID